MLFKFSNILFCLATRHHEIRNVSNLARKLVVSRPWCLQLLGARDVWPLARPEAELRRFGLEHLRVVIVGACTGNNE